VNDKESKDLTPQSSWGGAREGSGTKPAWFREEARKALAGLPPYSKSKIAYLSGVADGFEYEQKTNAQGELISVPVGVKERLEAVKILGKWAAFETVKIEGGDGGTPINVNPYSGITDKKDLETLEEILKRAGTTASTAPQG
jgi:hypothetical protein